jgi:hypothetical protein
MKYCAQHEFQKVPSFIAFIPVKFFINPSVEFTLSLCVLPLDIYSINFICINSSKFTMTKAMKFSLDALVESSLGTGPLASTGTTDQSSNSHAFSTSPKLPAMSETQTESCGLLPHTAAHLAQYRVKFSR